MKKFSIDPAILRWAAASFVLTFSFPTISKEFSIFVEPYTKVDELIGASAAIFLTGEIDALAPARVAGALAAQQAFGRHSTVYLNSPGGNLMAGMELGRVLRQYGVTTAIGAHAKNAQGFLEPKPAVCLSACALSFLGGYNRWVIEKSIYGVHRFYQNGELANNASNLDVGQILSAAIGTYIREMGVSPALFDLMVRAGANEIYALSTKELHELKVVNNGKQAAEWSLNVVDGGTYFKGEQETTTGTGKAMFSCVKGNVFFFSSYTAGENASHIEKGGWVHSLMIDKAVTIPLAEPLQLNNNKGLISASFPLNESQLRKILAAKKSLGHAMQLTRDAPTFVGYSVDIDEGSRNKLRAYVGNCLNGF